MLDQGGCGEEEEEQPASALYHEGRLEVIINNAVND